MKDGFKIVIVIVILFWIGNDLMQIRTIKAEKKYYNDYISREIGIVEAATRDKITILMNYLKFYSDDWISMGMLMDLKYENPEDVDSLLTKYAQKNDNLERPLDVTPNNYSFNNLYAFDETGRTEKLERLVIFNKLVRKGLYGIGTTSDCLGSIRIEKSSKDSIYLVEKPCREWRTKISVNENEDDMSLENHYHFSIPKTNQLDIRARVAFLSDGGLKIDTVRIRKTIYLER